MTKLKLYYNHKLILEAELIELLAMGAFNALKNSCVDPSGVYLLQVISSKNEILKEYKQ